MFVIWMLNFNRVSYQPCSCTKGRTFIGVKQAANKLNRLLRQKWQAQTHDSSFSNQQAHIVIRQQYFIDSPPKPSLSLDQIHFICHVQHCCYSSGRHYFDVLSDPMVDRVATLIGWTKWDLCGETAIKICGRYFPWNSFWFTHVQYFSALHCSHHMSCIVP